MARVVPVGLDADQAGIFGPAFVRIPSNRTKSGCRTTIGPATGNASYSTPTTADSGLPRSRHRMFFGCTAASFAQ